MFIFIFVILCIFRAEGNSPGALIEPRISGGVVSFWGEFPAAVRIATPFRQRDCMGTIIDRQHVLTAAHCVTTYSGQLENPFWFRVFAGDINIFPASPRREVRNVTRMFVSPGYQWNTRNHNLAVLRLSAPLPEFSNSIEPAIRRTKLLLPIEQCRFVGWGTNTLTSPNVRLEQRFINLAILSNAACNAANVHNNQVLSTMFCAGSLQASTNSICNGNDAGGLYCAVNNEWQLTGILTFGISCGAANQPGVFMEIRQYNSWLETQLVRSDNPAPGSMV